MSGSGGGSRRSSPIRTCTRTVPTCAIGRITTAELELIGSGTPHWEPFTKGHQRQVAHCTAESATESIVILKHPHRSI